MSRFSTNPSKKKVITSEVQPKAIVTGETGTKTTTTLTGHVIDGIQVPKSATDREAQAAALIACLAGEDHDQNRDHARTQGLARDHAASLLTTEKTSLTIDAGVVDLTLARHPAHHLVLGPLNILVATTNLHVPRVAPLPRLHVHHLLIQYAPPKMRG
eukprot:c8967_g1_i3.p2 GENE.c8967_g1_i3~~c8967_g1_i3.p2  ORF type:complete len:158 (+),score=15.52 c8967_g1_i3:134-607(+)